MIKFGLSKHMAITISKINMKNRRDIGIRAGDTVRVSQKIQEKEKTRIQVFEGLVLARKHGNEPGATFTVRRVSDGVGVEKIFPLYSPMIDKIEIVRRSKVRRSKLYYIREKVAREIRRQMRHMKLMDLATESDIAAKEKAKATEAEATATEASKNEKPSKDEQKETTAPATVEEKVEKTPAEDSSSTSKADTESPKGKQEI